MGSVKESNSFPRYEKPRGQDSAHRQWEGERWTLPPLCKESARGSSGYRRRWCPKSGKVLSPATAWCGPGLPGLEPDVSRLSSCSQKLRLEGVPPALARSQYGSRVASRVASSIGGAHTRVRPPPPMSLGTNRVLRTQEPAAPPSGREQQVVGDTQNAVTPWTLKPHRGRRCRM